MKRRTNELPDINTNAEPSLSNDATGAYYRQDDGMKADDSIESERRPKDSKHASSNIQISPNEEL